MAAVWQEEDEEAIEIPKGIPGFWLRIMQQCDECGKAIKVGTPSAPRTISTYSHLSGM